MENKYITYNRNTYGTVTDTDNNLYVMLQNAYLDGVESNAYFTAIAINPGDDSDEKLPVYELKWEIPEDADHDADLADYINWDCVDSVRKIGASFYLDDGSVC